MGSSVQSARIVSAIDGALGRVVARAPALTRLGPPLNATDPHILIAVYAERANQAGKDEKMEILYSYLISPEFQHRVQAIVEGFTYLLNDVEREKRWFETKWARQEKEIRKIIDSTQGMYGDLQAVTGRSLPTIAALELPEITAGTDVGDALSDASTPIAA